MSITVITAHYYMFLINFTEIRPQPFREISCLQLTIQEYPRFSRFTIRNMIRIAPRKLFCGTIPYRSRKFRQNPTTFSIPLTHEETKPAT